jgi:hypothetical protein
MTPRVVIWLLASVWLLVTAIVVGYPLCRGQIRVGLDPVRRDTAPKSFWSAYLVSTILFIAISGAVALVLRAVLPPLTR